MHCANCGALELEGARYCTRCGSLLDAPAPPDAGAGLEPSREVPWRGGQVISGVVIVVLFLVLIGLAADRWGPLAGEHEGPVAAWAIVHLMALAIFGVVWRLGVYRMPAPLEALGLAPLRLPAAGWRPGRTGLPDNPLLLAVAVFGASLAFTLVYGAVVDALGWERLVPPEIEGDFAFSGPAVLLTFEALAVVTPISEEVFFRGFVLRGITPRLGVAGAVVVSAAIFSVFHAHLGVLVPAFVTGLLLAWLYHRTGSLWPGILVHAANNALALGLQLYLV